MWWLLFVNNFRLFDDVSLNADEDCLCIYKVRVLCANCFSSSFPFFFFSRCVVFFQLGFLIKRKIFFVLDNFFFFRFLLLKDHISGSNKDNFVFFFFFYLFILLIANYHLSSIDDD